MVNKTYIIQKEVMKEHVVTYFDNETKERKKKRPNPDNVARCCKKFHVWKAK